MKSKFFRILGVVTIVSMLAGMLAAPALASVSAVSVTFGTAGIDDVIGKVNANYTVFTTIGTELKGASSGATFTLPDNGDSAVFTSAAATDTVTLAITAGTATITAGAGATYNAVTGVTTFTGIGQTVTVLATANDTAGTWARTGMPTASIGANVTVAPTVVATGGAFALPDGTVGYYDTVVITDVSTAPTVVAGGGAYSLGETGDSFVITASGDLTATLPAATTGAFAVSFPAGTGAYAAPTITFGTSLTAVVTATADATTGTWAPVALGLATAAAGTDVFDSATLTLTTGTATVVMSGAGTYTAGTGVIAFAAIGETATISGSIDGTAGTWARTIGVPTAAIGTNANQPPAFGAMGAATANGDTITITLPATTVVAGTVTATIAASPGWVGSPPVWTGASFANTKFTSVPGSRTITVTLGSAATQDVIGAGASVNINITAGITNPPTSGAYQLTVETSQEISPVLSAAYNIINPVMTPLPGVVSGFNSAGVLIAQSNSINAVIGTPGVITMTVGPGTYDEDVNFSVATLTSCVSTDGAATTIIKDTTNLSPLGTGGTVVISASPAAGLTVDGFTIYGRAGAATLTVNASRYATVKNCTIKAPGIAGIVTAGGSGSTTPATFSVVTVDVTGTAVLGASVTGGYASFSSCFFNVDIGGVGASVTAATAATFTSCGFTGSSNTGTGVVTVAGTAITVDTCSFTGLSPALNVTGATLFTLKNTTIDNCGSLATSTAAINVSGGTVAAYNNVVKNSPYYIGNFTGGTANMLFNDFAKDATTQTKGFIQPGGTILLSHNWWGAATVPAGYNNATISGVTEAKNPTGAAPNSAYFTTTAAGVWPTTITSATAAAGYGNLAITLATGGTLTAGASYASNPYSVAPVSPMTVIRYYDAFVTGGTAITIKFFSSGLTESAKVFYYDPAFGRWDVCGDQTVYKSSAYIEVKLTGAPAATWTGFYFALLDGADVPLPTGIVTPAQGATDIAVDTYFTWPSVAGSIGYDFALAEEIGQTDKFGIIDFSATTPTNAYKLADDLKFNTQYWWRFRSFNAAGVRTGWTVGTFTTGSEPTVAPTTTAPTTVVITVQPPDQPDITVIGPDTTPAIPTYLIWIVIAVGAVLVIVVIVLIVRTRRIG